MKQRKANLPTLYVEGADDVSVIAGLLARHGCDTERGTRHLFIEASGGKDTLLPAIPDKIKASRAFPCGFVLDIDIEITRRWQAVRERLRFGDDDATELQSPSADSCPTAGYIGRVRDYTHPFGVWLMPDCQSDGRTLEHLLQTLIPSGDPLWPHAEVSTARAAEIIRQVNKSAGASEWTCFGENDRIKAHLRCWLSWQKEPGLSFGAAINHRILGHDSPQARAFLDWIKRLFPNLPLQTHHPM